MVDKQKTISEMILEKLLEKIGKITVFFPIFDFVNFIK